MILKQLVVSTALAMALVQVAHLESASARDAGPPEAGFDNSTPKELKDIGIEEHLGDQVNLDLIFKDEAGAPVALRSFFKGHKPVILTLAYYNCPSLCSFHLNGLKDTFKTFKPTIGEEFEVVTVSIEPKETSELAAAKKASYIKSYGRPDGAKGWHFLVGDAAPVTELAKEVGFKYRWDEEAKQYAHASAAYILTPEGKISRYMYGIDFDPKALHLSVVEASNGQIGTIIDKINLFCFHYDTKSSKYSLATMNVMRAGAGLIVILICAFCAPYWFRKRKVEGES